MPVLKAVWKPEWYVRVYEMARDGMSVRAVKEVLGVSDRAWKKRWRSDPALRDAAKRGRECRRGGDGAFMTGYVFKHLSPELHKAYRELDRVFEVEDHPERFVEAILTPFGDRARKALYIHALVCSNFDGSRAGRKCGVSRDQIRRWCSRDREFARMVESEVREIKCDFVEGNVFRLVERGDTAATLWAAKCLLKSRGYSSQKDDDRARLTESVQVKLELEKLTAEELRAALSAMRQHSTPVLPPKTVEGEVIDAETVLSQEQ